MRTTTIVLCAMATMLAACGAERSVRTADDAFASLSRAAGDFKRTDTPPAEPAQR